MDTRAALADVSGVVENATALARSLPSETYSSQAYLDAELDRLFFKEWLYACPLALLPDERHAIPIVVAGQPVLLVKDPSGLSVLLRCRPDLAGPFPTGVPLLLRWR